MLPTDSQSNTNSYLTFAIDKGNQEIWHIYH